MRNSRNNFSTAPTKSVKNVPKSLPRILAQRKTSSSQTERVVLIKEENLSFYPYTRFGQNDSGMRRDYVKAVNYINSCHKFINAIIEKNSTDKSNTFLLPMITNFIPIFPYLIGKKPSKNKTQEKSCEKVIEKKSAKSEERKAKSNFAVKKIPEEAPPDPAPVGDCNRTIQEAEENIYATQVAGIVKEQIQNFLITLQEDMNKAMKKTSSDPPKQKCKNLDIVKQRLEELSKICFLQKNIESNQQIVQMSTISKPPPTPPLMTASTDCSIILSDTESEKTNRQKKTKTGSPYTVKKKSRISLVSGSSDIMSDAEFEIKKMKNCSILYLENTQSSNWHKAATPLLIQCLCGLSVSKVIYMTKFVECPVVDKIPLLALVL